MTQSDSDVELVEAAAGLDSTDRAIEDMHKKHGDDADSRDDYHALEETRDEHIATLITVPATSTVGIQAKASVLRSQRMIEDYNRHQQVAVSLAEDILGSESPPLVPAGWHPADKLDALWQERQQIVRQENAIHRRLDDARERMPAWAKSGAEYINAAGERCGHNVGWPEVAVLPAAPEISYARRLIRVSPQHIKENFENYVSLYPGSSKRALRLRAKARENYRASMRRLIARLRERRAIEGDLGIPAMEAKVDVLYDRRWGIKDAIEKLPPTINQAAALALIEALIDGKSGSSVSDPDDHLSPILIMLRGIRPYLTGAIRVTVDRMFNEPDATLAELDLAIA